MAVRFPTSSCRITDSWELLTRLQHTRLHPTIIQDLLLHNFPTHRAHTYLSCGHPRKIKNNMAMRQPHKNYHLFGILLRTSLRTDLRIDNEGIGDRDGEPITTPTPVPPEATIKLKPQTPCFSIVLSFIFCACEVLWNR